MYTNVPPPAWTTHATNYMTHEGVFPIPTVPDSSRVSPRGFFSPVSFRTRLAQGCTLPFPFMRLMIWRGFIRLLWLFTICHNRAYSASEYNPLSHDMGRSPTVSRHGDMFFFAITGLAFFRSHGPTHLYCYSIIGHLIRSSIRLTTTLIILL